MSFRSLFRAPSRRSPHRRGQLEWACSEALESRRLMSFTPAASYATGGVPQDVTTGDFNGDGRLDLAVADWSNSAVSVLLGNADGTFQALKSSPTGAEPLSLAVGDFDADGNLDVATANEYDVSVLLGNGDGTFRPPTSLLLRPGDPAFEGPDEPDSVAVGDFNGDGTLDLGVTANTLYRDYGYYGTASVLLGNGDGTFATPITNYLEWGFNRSAAVADFNGDGNQDFAAGNVDLGTAVVLLGDGSGYLYGQGSFYAGNSAWAIAAGDVNGDLKIDVVSAGHFSDTVSVLLGDGSGGFAPPQNYAVLAAPTDVLLGDFNNDGLLDIAAATGFGVSILRGTGGGTFSNPENFAAGAGAYAITAGDFNGDGWLDVAAVNPANNAASVLINDGSWPDPPPPSVSINDAPAVIEGNAGTVLATFTVTLSNASASDVSVNYTTANITASSGSDYTAASGTVTIPAGQTGGTFTVAVSGDRLAELTESFAVNLSSPTNATIGDSQGIATIVDDEPWISIGDVSKVEGKKPKQMQFTFTVTLSGAYDQAVTVSYRTADGTATTADGDYLAKTGTLTFLPGETSKTITIVVNGDNKREGNETFFVELFGNSSNSWFNKSRGIGSVLNDDR